MQPMTRRGFTGSLLGSLAAFSLIELLHQGQAFADKVKPVIDKFVLDLNALALDLKSTRKLTDLEFQTKLETLYSKVNLSELLKFLELDKLEKTVKLPANGARSVGFDLSQIEGLPKQVVFGKQIFCMGKGRSVVPHGHSNMCTGFIILRGEFEGKHYDRLETHDDHYVIRPTIDRVFKPGEFSSISDHKDNIHWFKAISESGFIFNIHVLGYDPSIKETTGRLYLDPEGEKLRGGLIRAPKLDSASCHKKFG